MALMRKRGGTPRLLESDREALGEGGAGNDDGLEEVTAGPIGTNRAALGTQAMAGSAGGLFP